MVILSKSSKHYQNESKIQIDWNDLKKDKDHIEKAQDVIEFIDISSKLTRFKMPHISIQAIQTQ